MTLESFPHFMWWNKVRTLTTAPDYEMHELYDAFSYSKHKLKVRTLTAALDYEMHELYDAFS